MLAAVLLQGVEYYVRRRPLARVLCWLRGSAAGALLVLLGFAGTFAIKLTVDAQAIAATGGAPAAASFIYFRF
jgi:hypothetical protein